MNYRRLFIQNGLIFITIVTYNRIPILIDNMSILKKCYKNVRKYYNFKLIAYSIQPDHLHCIIKPTNINEYPKIIKSFKYSVTKLINAKNTNQVKSNNINTKIWQSRYWEHTIKNKTDLNTHFDYIHYNPVKHKLVNLPKDWIYSSFHKFVKQNLYNINWGNNINIDNLTNLDFE